MPHLPAAIYHIFQYNDIMAQSCVTLSLQSPCAIYMEHGREPELLRDRTRWGANDVPQTKIVSHVPGESGLVFSSNAYPQLIK
jgi:hypothetical protein